MKRKNAFLSLFCTGLALLGFQSKESSSTSSSARNICWVTIQGPIDVTAVALIQRALREAHGDQSPTLIIEVDSEGGEVDKMWQIARPLSQEKEVETVAFVNRKAMSAGAFISIACKKLYMAPSASIGAAMPVKSGPTGLIPVAEDRDVRNKIYAAFRADMRGLAESRGRSGAIAEAMVDPEVGLQRVEVDNERRILKSEEVDELIQKGQTVKVIETLQAKGSGPLSITAEAAQSYNFIDGIAQDREKLLQWLGLENAEIKEIKPSWSEDLVRFLSSIAPVLLILGFLCAIVEMKIPGFGFFGVLSISCFALLFFGNFLAGVAEIFHIILFIVGIALILVEVFAAPGTIVPGVVGFLCVIYGLVSSFVGFYWPTYNLDFAALKATGEMFIVSMFVIIVVGLFLVWYLSKYLHTVPYYGKHLVTTVEQGEGHGSGVSLRPEMQSVLLGKRAVAHTDLRPAGKILIENEIIDAQSLGTFIQKGSTVKIIEISTNRIVVEELKSN